MKEEEKGKSPPIKRINVSELDEGFKYELAKMPGGEKITRCFQCGTCTAGCPVREVNESYNPRKIIRMALLGMRDEVVKEDFVWLCSTCYTCTERCPQDVRITDLMFAIKNYAVEHGYIHPSFKIQAELIRDQGRLYAIEEFENKRRAKQGLPELPEKDEAAALIMKVSGLMKILEEGEDEE